MLGIAITCKYGGHVGDRGEGTFTINVFICDGSVAAGCHVDLYRPYPVHPATYTMGTGSLFWV
jgi:hypothetical protein